MKVKTKTFGKASGARGAGRTGTRAGMKKRDAHLGLRKRFCRFCQEGSSAIDYKDAKRLESFITERGKIVSPRISGNCAKHQRRLAESIRQARFVSILPYIR